MIAERDRRLRRRRAARGHVPRALRRAERRAVPRAVRGAAPAGGGAARRPEAELVDRAELAGKLGLEAYYPWKDIEEYLRHRSREAGLSLATLKQKGIVRGKAAADLRRGRRPSRRSTRRRARSSSTRPAQGRGLRPGAEVPAARAGSARVVPAALRPRAGAHVQPHADQPAPPRPDGGERGLGERERREPPGPHER